MESMISSDDSSENDTFALRNELAEFGLVEDNLCKEEMISLLTALKSSKPLETEDKLQLRQIKHKVFESDSNSSPKETMKRRCFNVRDRRLPWCLLPTNISPTLKADTLAVYIKLMSINKYRQARRTLNLSAWPRSIQVAETNKLHSLRSTRCGQSVPIYAGFDDDTSNFDCVITKAKRRRISDSDTVDKTYSDKVISLKRIMSKDEILRPPKEVKISNDLITNPSETCVNTIDVFSLIED